MQHLEKLIPFMLKVASMLRKDNEPDVPADTSTLPTKEQVLKWQLSLEQLARAQYQQELNLCVFQRQSQQLAPIFSKAVATLLMEVVLVSFFSGYIPPLRLACIRSLKVPNAPCVPGTGKACEHEDCSKSGCKGNRLEVMDEPYSAADMAGQLAGTPVAAIFNQQAQHGVQQIRVILEHHKNSHRPGNQFVQFVLPCAMAVMLHKFLTHGHPTLTLETECKTLFVSPSGNMMEETQMSPLWQSIQQKHKAPWQPFPPRLFRHIHACFEMMELADAVAATGLQDQFAGTNMLMGNSLNVLGKHYTPTYWSMIAEATIKKITKWREQVCGQASS